MNHSLSRRRAVLVKHDDALVCAGLVAVLKQHGLFDVYLDGCDSMPVSLPAIDVVIADYEVALALVTPGGHARRTELMQARIMVLTANDRELDIRRAVEAGVHGYLLLGGSLHELVEAVTTVATGARYLCRAGAQKMADSLSRSSLTLREIDVLRLVVAGEPNKAIARKLDIEVGTVKSHISAILGKLGAMSRTQAAAIATSCGLVTKPAASESITLSSARNSTAMHSLQMPRAYQMQATRQNGSDQGGGNAHGT